MKQLLAAVATIALSYAVMELYLAFRPADLSDEIRDWLESSTGRFEQWLAERDRRKPGDRDTD